MNRLTESLSAWGTSAFKDTFKQELGVLDSKQLPLQQGLRVGDYAVPGSYEVMIISSSVMAGAIRVKIGVFYQSVIAGCNCADDPTPIETNNEYCEVLVDIDKATAGVTITLCSD